MVLISTLLDQAQRGFQNVELAEDGKVFELYLTYRFLNFPLSLGLQIANSKTTIWGTRKSYEKGALSDD